MIFWRETDLLYFCTPNNTVVVAQLVRASDCGSEGRRFEPGHPPEKEAGNCLFFNYIFSLGIKTYEIIPMFGA